MPIAVLPNVPRAEERPSYHLVAGRPYAEPNRPLVETNSGHPVAIAARPVGGHWAIQVGAYNTPMLAHIAIEGARQGANLIGGEPAVSTVEKGHGVLYRARLTGFSPAAARDACYKLRQIGSDCIIVSPEGGEGGA
jgi:hypothetical protein